MQSTLVMIKPNGVLNGIIGNIISRYERSRLTLSAIKIKRPTEEEVRGFYAEHQEKPFFPKLLKFMTSGPVAFMVLSGENAITSARTINGATSPEDAAPGTIRYDFAPDTTRNVVHSSDSPESAEREIDFWFNDNELISYPAISFKC
ncbi:MAG: nucleoside-diphosphate kinase [Fibrobacteria bacterium]|nr:nucleoside-diphosphate kinase [Fibrobacteria bacterium]